MAKEKSVEFVQDGSSENFFDTAELKEILMTFRESGLQHMTLERGNSKLVLEAAATRVHGASLPEGTSAVPFAATETVLTERAEAGVSALIDVRAPLVGTFYAAAEDNAEPYVAVGDSVKQGDTLCIIEAMKMLNYIEAPADGIIHSIKVENTNLVEYDQLLMEIVPHDV